MTCKGMESRSILKLFVYMYLLYITYYYGLWVYIFATGTFSENIYDVPAVS